MKQPIDLVLIAVFWVGSVIAAGGCRRAVEEGEATAGDGTAGRKQADVLVFPGELRVADAAVDDFITRAMAVCGAGDYDAFRLLWSVREDPMPRDEFDEGWQAVQMIRVRGLEKVQLAREEVGDGDETVYILLAEVRLDPAHRAGRREPQREVALMLVREHDEWRLAKAPKKMRDWIKDHVNTGAPEAGGRDAAPTTGSTGG